MSSFKKIKNSIKRAISQAIYKLTDGMARKGVVEEKTLVIVKNDFIGDYILFRNFLPYIKQSQHYKDYKIILIGNITWKDLAETLDAAYYDEMIWIAYDKLFGDLSYRSHVMKSILKRSFDTLFYPVYTGDYYTENFFISKINARRKIKVTPLVLDEALKNTQIFNEMFHTTHPDLFEIYRYKETMELLLNISIHQFNWRPLFSDSYLYPSVPEKPYVVFFPGSSAHLKRWDTSNFVEVAKHLINKYNYDIVLAGSKKDHKHAHAIISGVGEVLQHKLIDYTGKTSLLDLANLIKHSELLVTNDSASIHMAASMNKEAICVFMGENYGRFAPYPKEVYANGIFICPPSVKLLIKENQETSTFLSLDYNPNIDDISAQQVIDNTEILLSKKHKAVTI